LPPAKMDLRWPCPLCAGKAGRPCRVCSGEGSYNGLNFSWGYEGPRKAAGG